MLGVVVSSATRHDAGSGWVTGTGVPGASVGSDATPAGAGVAVASPASGTRYSSSAPTGRDRDASGRPPEAGGRLEDVADPEHLGLVDGLDAGTEDPELRQRGRRLAFADRRVQAR